jgi:cytochrome c biogenesis protein CcmG, thiol:disulfide interchange protein DsbE
MKRPVFLAVAIALGGFFVYISANGFGKDPHAVPFMLDKKPAPDFKLKRLDNGEEVTLSSLRGKPVVINFWATWCGPCKAEHPVLEWGAKTFAGKVEFLAIVFEDNEANTRRFLEQYGWSLTQLFDPKSTVAVDYAVAGVPETYFITKEGTIALKYANPVNTVTLSAGIAQILGDPALDKSVAETAAQVYALKLKKLNEKEPNTLMLVRGLLAQGMGPAQVIESAKKFDSDFEASSQNK